MHIMATTKRNYLGFPKGVRQNGLGYSAALGKDGIRYHLGTYTTPEKAGNAWQEANTLTHEQLKELCKPRVLSPYSQAKAKEPQKVVTKKLEHTSLDIPDLNNLWYQHDTSSLPIYTTTKQCVHYTSSWVSVSKHIKPDRIRV